MAEEITKKQIKELPVIPYEKVRDYIKTGHIFFSSGSYAFSGIIQRLTKSAWSHVAIVYKDKELQRVLILEANRELALDFAHYLSILMITKERKDLIRVKLY